LGFKALAPHWVEHYSGNRTVVIRAGDADGKQGDPEQEVDRPVQRVDDPAKVPGPVSRAAHKSAATLLPHHLVARTPFGQDGPYRPLGLHVGFGHEICRPTLRTHIARPLTKPLEQHRCRRTSRFTGDLEQLHLKTFFLNHAGSFYRMPTSSGWRQPRRLLS
jgi:hypothetical protein